MGDLHEILDGLTIGQFFAYLNKYAVKIVKNDKNEETAFIFSNGDVCIVESLRYRILKNKAKDLI